MLDEHFISKGRYFKLLVWCEKPRMNDTVETKKEIYHMKVHPLELFCYNKLSRNWNNFKSFKIW